MFLSVWDSLVTRSRLTGIATPALSKVATLPVTYRTVYARVMRSNSLRLPSVSISSQLSLYSLSASLVSLSARCTLHGGRSLYIQSPGCTTTRNRSFSPKLSKYLPCAATCLPLAFSVETGRCPADQLYRSIARRLSCTVRVPSVRLMQGYQFDPTFRVG